MLVPEEGVCEEADWPLVLYGQKALLDINPFFLLSLSSSPKGIQILLRLFREGDTT